MIFQFPLLGIFPCIKHAAEFAGYLPDKLSIPFTWDFSMHLFAKETEKEAIAETFNSLYLGFFHASFCNLLCFVLCIFYFQFPLLGIFPCIASEMVAVIGSLQTFNSLYLGFFHASKINWNWGDSAETIFQFPLLGIFPCIIRMRRGWKKLRAKLSIPFTWDFSMHQKPGCILKGVACHLSIPFTWDFSMHL